MFQAGSACYSTPAAAISASVSNQTGTVVQNGGVSSVLTVSNITDNSVTYSLTPISGGPVVSTTVLVEPQPCSLLTASDAISLSWAIVLVWLVAWGLAMLARHVNNQSSSSDYGNT